MIIQITRKTWRILGIVLAIAAAGILYAFPQLLEPVFSKTKDPVAEEVLTEDVETVCSSDKEITASSEPAVYAVHVSGAVCHPDQVWYLPEGSRVKDAIEAAGGASKKADLSRLNLAQPVTDSMKIYVPKQGEIMKNDLASGESASQEQRLVNINTASAEELTSLSGIGTAYAERILQYRAENGPFAAPEDLMNVKGIGEKTFEKIKDRICV
ncbi:MAG: helix-hairpin-helix domain-containing protein [Clostridiales bacterium]|nr:helix-hairpin-helix domain-containing protein [Clostridiales bacterium]